MTVLTTLQICFREAASALRRPARCGISLFALAFLFAIAPGFALAQYEIGAAPAWVTPEPFDRATKIPRNEISDGVHYLLIDSQTRVHPGEETCTYRHIAIKVVNTNGIEDASQISIDFDPEYEQVTLHTVRMHRGEAHAHQLDHAGSRFSSARSSWRSRSTTAPVRSP